jgi:hypothetical protein
MVADFLSRKTLPSTRFSQVRAGISTQSYSNFGLEDLRTAPKASDEFTELQADARS